MILALDTCAWAGILDVAAPLGKASRGTQAQVFSIMIIIITIDSDGIPLESYEWTLAEGKRKLKEEKKKKEQLRWMSSSTNLALNLPSASSDRNQLAN